MTSEAPVKYGPLTVKWNGLREIDEAFKRLPMEFNRRAVLVGLTYGAQTYRDGMSRRAPERTGALKAGIGYKVTVKVDGQNVAKIGPQAMVFYGSFVELGTRKMKAKPFMRPTMYEDGEQAISAFVHGVRSVFESLLPRSMRHRV